MVAGRKRMKGPVKLSFVPRWNAAIEGHAVNLVRKFYPKLAAEHEFDDLLQEAYIVFMRCKERYAGKVDNPRWFMALFSRSLFNRLMDLSKRCGTYISIEALEDAFPEPATEYDEAYFACLLRELPKEFRQLVDKVINGDMHDPYWAVAALKRKYNI